MVQDVIIKRKFSHVAKISDEVRLGAHVLLLSPVLQYSEQQYFINGNDTCAAILALVANVFHIGLQAVQKVAIEFASMDPLEFNLAATSAALSKFMKGSAELP